MRRRKGVIYPEKTHITISVDKEVLEKCTSIKNLSAFLNTCLKNYVKAHEHDQPQSCSNEMTLSEAELNQLLDSLGD